MKFFFICFILIFLGWACQKFSSQESEPITLFKKGHTVYMAHCVSCHAPNPAIDGPIGPAIKGSSFELLRARLLQAAYPPGYTPKRPTRNMPALPHLEKDLEALAAFLNR